MEIKEHELKNKNGPNRHNNIKNDIKLDRRG